MASNYTFGIFKLYLFLLPLVILMSVRLRFTTSDHPFGIFKMFNVYVPTLQNNRFFNIFLLIRVVTMYVGCAQCFKQVTGCIIS